LSNLISQDIARYLADNGFGTLDTDINRVVWNDRESKQLLITDTGGSGSDLPELYASLKFQILSRGEKHKAADLPGIALNAVHDFLAKAGPVTINGCAYGGFFPIAPPFALGPDENDRYIYTCNFSTNRGL